MNTHNQKDGTALKRRRTRIVHVGNVPVGGGFPVSIQSMTTTPTHDLERLLPEIKALESAGCQIVRVAVPDKRAVTALRTLKKQSSLPLVADIHFDYRLALAAIDAGVDKIRINPGNIGQRERVMAVLKAAKAAGIPIRIGVNSGSLEKELLRQSGHPTAEAMVASARRHIEICRENDFEDIIVALKSSNVPLMIAANRHFADEFDYPIHLGVTEAGPCWQGGIASAVGIGTLLAQGIGDTLRVSLTADPVEEVRVGYEILKTLKLTSRGIRIVSCPTCGRAAVNIFDIVRQVEQRVRDISKNLTVAVMGCAVNGPGEAREADLGIAGGKREFLLFKKGKVIAKIKESEAVDRLLEEIEHYSPAEIRREPK